MASACDVYASKLKNYVNLIEEQNKSIKIIALFRFFTFLIGLIVTAYIFIIKNYLASIGVLIVSLAIFIYLILLHDKAVKRRKYSIALKEINERALKRLTGEWKDFQDDGSEYKESNHSYSDDLDIFGKGSLFQWVNSSKTFIGRETLKNRLINPINTPDNIKLIQQSLQELAMNLDWRQQFEAEGMVIANQNINLEQLYKWAEGRNDLYTKLWLILLVRILPCIALALIVISYFISIIDFKLPCFMILVQLIILFIGSKERSATFNNIYKYKNSINVYLGLLTLITSKDFKSEYLKGLKNELIDDGEKDAVRAIKKLSNIYDKMSDRQNGLFMIFNILLLWDYQCMIEFEEWRTAAGQDIRKWFEVIGQFEALNSISNIIYNNPQWVVPEVSNSNFVIKAERLGHPLLCDTRVCNDITINNQKNILIITGSNMSGKSTFLRTVGINLILSYIGATVCAEKFECSIMDIFTCMRISDNLENNISSFYAEILRIKLIVEAVKENKKIFFLLDELFKGTNSIDRHTGAKALIKQLGEYGASGIISTHDLELCDLQYEYDKIKNYYFQEYYINNELKFDYMIREGISNTKNALYLIRMAGIDLV